MTATNWMNQNQDLDKTKYGKKFKQTEDTQEKKII